MNVEPRTDLTKGIRDDAIIGRLLAALYSERVVDSPEQYWVIACCGVGTIDVGYATDPGNIHRQRYRHCQHEVSEHAIVFSPTIHRYLIEYDAALKNGSRRRDVTVVPIHRFHGQILGPVGYGSVARLVVEKARALGMGVVATDSSVAADVIRDAGVEKTDFEEVLPVADVVSLHTPLTNDIRGILDASEFRFIKDSAYLVNVAHGESVVNDDLVDTLRTGKIGGAGLDVYEQEPADPDNGVPAFESPRTSTTSC